MLVHEKTCKQSELIQSLFSGPVQKPEHWTNVVVFPCLGQYTSSSVLYVLQLFNSLFREASEETIAVVYSAGDKGMN